MTSEMLSADKYLSIINERGKRALPLKRVYRNMRQRGLFYKAYENLYSNPGATTPGTDPNDTIQGMSVERIDAIIQKLTDGTYRWQPTRRTYVPKANGQKRPISMPGWSDKLVQEVMRLILEAYYEPQFRKSSHGFRPNHSCFTALKQIKETWTGTKWFIEGDIKGCFDNISKDLLLRLLARRIHDNRFLKLLKGMLDAGYMEDWQYHQTHSGVPQGGVVSPTLSNVVLNELDKWIEDELIPQHTKGQQRKRSADYACLIKRRSDAKRQGQWKRYTQLGKELRCLPSKDPYDPDFRRLRFVRFADDFLLGYIGTKSEAEGIKEQISEFLSGLGLILSQEKTLITHARSETARFLGYEISTSWRNDKLAHNPQGKKMRSVNGHIHLGVPRSVATKWMRKYCTKGKPQHNKGLLLYSDYEIVTTYGAQIRGLTNYYQLAPNLSQRLNRVHWACVQSCRKTLATKHKLSTPKSYKRYYVRADGERSHIRVTIERPDKQPLIAKCGEQSLKYRPNATYAQDKIQPFTPLERQRELTQRLLAEECEVCGATGVPLEGHHVNKLSELKHRWQGRKQKPAWVEWMLSRHRKTIFVCRSCHLDITYGRYDGATLH
jgi:group II intron reverse transcriptase/maturase